jgi:hypothetical protein
MDSGLLGSASLFVLGGVPDPSPTSMIHHWIQFFELSILIPHLTTSDPNLTTSGQLPVGVADPAM